MQTLSFCVCPSLQIWWQEFHLPSKCHTISCLRGSVMLILAAGFKTLSIMLSPTHGMTKNALWYYQFGTWKTVFAGQSLIFRNQLLMPFWADTLCGLCHLGWKWSFWSPIQCLPWITWFPLPNVSMPYRTFHAEIMIIHLLCQTWYCSYTAHFNCWCFQGYQSAATTGAHFQITKNNGSTGYNNVCSLTYNHCPNNAYRLLLISQGRPFCSNLPITSVKYVNCKWSTHNTYLSLIGQRWKNNTVQHFFYMLHCM